MKCYQPGGSAGSLSWCSANQVLPISRMKFRHSGSQHSLWILTVRRFSTDFKDSEEIWALEFVAIVRGSWPLSKAPERISSLCPPLAVGAMHTLQRAPSWLLWPQLPGCPRKPFTPFDCLKFYFDLILLMIFKSELNTISRVSTLVLLPRKRSGRPFFILGFVVNILFLDTFTWNFYQQT